MVDELSGYSANFINLLLIETVSMMVNRFSDKIKSVRPILIGLMFLIVAAAPYGCKTGQVSGFREGKVVYDVEFEAEGIPPMMKAMLPSEITTYFSNDRTCTVINMGMNMMETKLISDAVRYTYTTLINGMGNKKAMIFDQEMVKKQFLDRVPLKVVFTDEKKEIAGVQCRQAMITDSTNHVYPVFYTEEIALSDPNWCTPFNEIKGLLMEYSISFGNFVMKLKAKKIVEEKAEQTWFEIPEGYERITDPSQLKFGF